MGLLERDEQLAVVVDRFGELSDGGRLVLISGEAGAGKTALVDAFCAMHTSDATVLVGRCDDLFASRPLGPFADIARQHPGALGAALAAGDPAAVYDAFLSDLAGSRQPVVVVLEDLQWADEATLDLLRFVARRLDVLHCMVLATYRDDVASDHPLRRAWGSLVGPSVTRMTLPPLSLAAVRELAKGTKLDAASLHARTEGNAFFVVEVVAAEHERLPSTVRDTILSRAARLSGPARDALDAAAILGRVFTAELVVAVADCDIAAIDECIGAGLLVEQGDVLAFRHDLTREAIESSLTPLRGRQLHRRALEKLRDSEDVVRRAHHAIGAGDRDAIVDLATVAADECVALGAHAQAATLYRRVVDFADSLPAGERLRVLQAYARASMHVEHVAEAVEAAERALEVLRTTDDVVATAAWESWLTGPLWAAGRLADAWELGLDAVRRLESVGDSPELARALAQLSGQQLVSGRFRDALANGRRALALADHYGLDDVAVHAMDKSGSAAYCLGDDEGISVLWDAIDRGKRTGQFYEACTACSNLGEALAARSDLQGALGVFSSGLALAEEHELVYRRNCLLMCRMESLLASGDWDAATGDAETLLAQQNIAIHHRAMALRSVGLVTVRRQGWEAARQALDEALHLASSFAESQIEFPVRMARAEALWLDGQMDRAHQEVRATLTMVEFLETTDIRDLALWADRCGVEFEAPANAAEPFRAMRDGRWREAADYWSSRGYPYAAADALASSSDEADLRDAHEQLIALGALPRARQVARRLRDLGARDVPRGPRATTRANAAGLTAREGQVAALLANGMSNAEIADRLVVSVKTVDHHVSAVLAKLHVDSRRGVAAAAAGLGLELDSL